MSAAAKYSDNSAQSLTNNRMLVSGIVGARPVGNTEYSFASENLLVNGDMSGSGGWGSVL